MSLLRINRTISPIPELQNTYLTGESPVLLLSLGKYLVISGAVNTLTIELPSSPTPLISSNIFLTTGTTPNITWSPQTSTHNVLFYDGYNLEPESTYEFNIVYIGGNQWIVAWAKCVTLSTT